MKKHLLVKHEIGKEEPSSWCRKHQDGHAERRSLPCASCRARPQEHCWCRHPGTSSTYSPPPQGGGAPAGSREQLGLPVLQLGEVAMTALTVYLNRLARNTLNCRKLPIFYVNHNFRREACLG